MVEGGENSSQVQKHADAEPGPEELSRAQKYAAMMAEVARGAEDAEEYDIEEDQDFDDDELDMHNPAFANRGADLMDLDDQSALMRQIQENFYLQQQQ